MKCKHILIVTSEFPPLPGGIGTHAYHLALYLSKNGYSVTVIADQRAENSHQELGFDTALPFEVKRIKRRRVRFFMYLSRILKTLKGFKMAHVVIATGKFSLWNVAFCSLLHSCKTIAVIHGSEVNFKAKLPKLLVDASLKTFDTIVAVSSYTKQLVSHIKKPVAVIPNAINVDTWQPKTSQSTSLKGRPVLLTVGRVSLRKGQLEVIKLLPELVNTYPELMYHCVGIPTEAETFRSIARELGVEQHVVFHGAVEEANLKELVSSADVFVMLSVEDHKGDVEGFGIAILEANAMGIPAIGSIGCGIEDAINDGISGFLVRPNDVSAFKKALVAILSDTESFSLNAIDWANQHCWESIIKEYMKLIEQDYEN